MVIELTPKVLQTPSVSERNSPRALGIHNRTSRMGKAGPSEAGRGKVFPACESGKGQCGGGAAKKQKGSP